MEKYLKNKQTKINDHKGDENIEAVEKQGEKKLAVLNNLDLCTNKKDHLLFLKQKEVSYETFIINDLIG